MKNIKKFLQTALLMCIVFIGTATAQTNVRTSAHFPESFASVLGDQANLRTTDSLISVEIWAKRDTAPTGTIQTICDYAGWMGNIFNINETGNVLTASYGAVSVSYTYTPDTNWHHIAFTCDKRAWDDSITLFYDGLIVGTHIGAHPIVGTTGVLSIIGIGSKIDNTKKWIGSLSNFVLYDTLITFNDNCVYDTAGFYLNNNHVFGHTRAHCSLTGTDSSQFIVSYNWADTNLLDGRIIHAYETSPCMPTYTFSYDTSIIDSIRFYAHNYNNSFNKGSYIPHTKNGWDTTISVPAIYGTFTDSITVFADSIVLTYTDESGDTTGHGGARKPLTDTTNYTAVNTYTQHTINIYPNPSYGSYTITDTHGDAIIYDMTGRIIKQYYVNGTHTDILNAGIYIIRINNTSYKLIIR